MKLTAEERETILRISDADESWTVFTESRRLTGRLLKLCQKLGVEPEREGEGYSFMLPFESVRFGVKRLLSEPERARRREHIRRLHSPVSSRAI